MQHAGPSVLSVCTVCLHCLPLWIPSRQGKWPFITEKRQFPSDARPGHPRCLTDAVLGGCWHSPGSISRAGAAVFRLCPWCLGAMGKGQVPSLCLGIHVVFAPESRIWPRAYWWLGKPALQRAVREGSRHSLAAALLRRRKDFKEQLTNIAISREAALGVPDNGLQEANRLKALILVRYI